MLNCFFMRRKLYDYLDNSLAEAEKEKVRHHLNVCKKCGRELSHLRLILQAAQARQAPEMNEHFWHGFRTDLDRRLNQELLPPLEMAPQRAFRLRLIPAYAAAAIFLFTIGAYFYYNNPAYKIRLGKADTAIINEAALLDEVGDTPYLNSNESAYLDELNLLFELEQA